MQLDTFDKYLLIINVIGFLAFAINAWLYDHEISFTIDPAVTLITIIGGSAGVLLAILFFDRKPSKGTMMSRVFIACVFVIQLVILLVLKGHVASELTFAFWEFFRRHKLILAYLAVINFIAFAAFAIDKIAAMKNRSRIRIVTLLGLAFIGGSAGSLAGMYLFHHKTRKDYFAVGVPLILLMQVVVLFYAMNVRV